MKAIFLLLISLTIAPLCSTELPALEAKAASGDREAQFELGRAFLKGEGVEKDPVKAVGFLRSSAEKGHAEATGALGFLYSTGLAVEKNDEKAREYFEKSVALGSATYQPYLGLWLVRGKGGNKDVARGLLLLEQAAKSENERAKLLLGEIYYMGEHAGNVPDYAKAYEVLIGPANAGNPIAQNTIGLILQDGKIGSKDQDAARVWFEKAAGQGNAKACINLSGLWKHDSSDHNARLESLRWLLVAKALGDFSAETEYQEIKSFFSNAEEQAASSLADLTLKAVKKNR